MSRRNGRRRSPGRTCFARRPDSGRLTNQGHAGPGRCYRPSLQEEASSQTLLGEGESKFDAACLSYGLLARLEAGALTTRLELRRDADAPEEVGLQSVREPVQLP